MLTGLRLATNGLICTRCEAWRSASHHFIAGRALGYRVSLITTPHARAACGARWARW